MESGWPHTISDSWYWVSRCEDFWNARVSDFGGQDQAAGGDWSATNEVQIYLHENCWTLTWGLAELNGNGTSQLLFTSFDQPGVFHYLLGSVFTDLFFYDLLWSLFFPQRLVDGFSKLWLRGKGNLRVESMIPGENLWWRAWARACCVLSPQNPVLGGCHFPS